MTLNGDDEVNRQFLKYWDWIEISLVTLAIYIAGNFATNIIIWKMFRINTYTFREQMFLCSASLIKGELSYALHGYKSTEHFVYSESFIIQFCIICTYLFWSPIHYVVFGCWVKKFEDNKHFIREVRDHNCIKYTNAGDSVEIDPKYPKVTDYIHQLVSAPILIWDGWERRDEIAHMKHELHEHMEIVEGEVPSEDSSDGSEGSDDGIGLGKIPLDGTITDKDSSQQ